MQLRQRVDNLGVLTSVGPAHTKLVFPHNRQYDNDKV